MVTQLQLELTITTQQLQLELTGVVLYCTVLYCTAW